MYDDIVDLFAPEGNVEVAGQGVFKGADGVRRFLKRFGAPGLDPGELNDRPQLMPEVSISDDGGTALVRVTELGMTGQHGGEGYWSLAVDTFLLTRGDDGKWRIMILHRRPLMRANYKDGWAHPLPAPLPMGEGVTVDAPAQPVDTDYPTHAFNMQMLGIGRGLPASRRGEAAGARNQRARPRRGVRRGRERRRGLWRIRQPLRLGRPRQPVREARAGASCRSSGSSSGATRSSKARRFVMATTARAQAPRSRPSTCSRSPTSPSATTANASSCARG